MDRADDRECGALCGECPDVQPEKAADATIKHSMIPMRRDRLAAAGNRRWVSMVGQYLVTLACRALGRNVAASQSAPAGQ